MHYCSGKTSRVALQQQQSHLPCLPLNHYLSLIGTLQAYPHLWAMKLAPSCNAVPKAGAGCHKNPQEDMCVALQAAPAAAAALHHLLASERQHQLHIYPGQGPSFPGHPAGGWHQNPQAQLHRTQSRTQRAAEARQAFKRTHTRPFPLAVCIVLNTTPTPNRRPQYHTHSNRPLPPTLDCAGPPALPSPTLTVCP